MSATSLLRLAGVLSALLMGCVPVQELGKAPEFSSSDAEIAAMMQGDAPVPFALGDGNAASLWTGERGSLLGDRRAANSGDILTVVIEINDSAQMSNSSDRSRSGTQALSISQLFGLTQKADAKLPSGASLGSAVDLGSDSQFQGDGSVSRKEKLTLRIAATIVDTLPNGILALPGSQEVRVNYELRELWVTGYVRPADITRQNEITYDKIASARISYGGRGLISQMQQPRIGQQLTESLLPF